MLHSVAVPVETRQELPVGNESLMMSVDEVAERWGVNKKTVLRAIQLKQIIALRVGRTIRIARAHVERLEERGVDTDK
jgi:excisionase family DNA binding protein